MWRENASAPQYRSSMLISTRVTSTICAPSIPEAPVTTTCKPATPGDEVDGEHRAASIH